MPLRLRNHKMELGLRLALAALSGAICLYGLACPAVAKGRGVRGQGSWSPVPAAEFAIGDFDGDRIPDLATVEAMPNGARGNSRYSIRFQLTSGAAQIFGVTAPAGGLLIVAQDINGDNALDVLVRTPWLHKAVAVLLNDGHGNFTLADPAAFPASTGEKETRWGFGAVSYCESGVLVRFENSQGDFGIHSIIENSHAQRPLAFRRDTSQLRRFLISSVLDRAPPVAAQI